MSDLVPYDDLEPGRPARPGAAECTKAGAAECTKSGAAELTIFGDALAWLTYSVLVCNISVCVRSSLTPL